MCQQSVVQKLFVRAVALIALVVPLQAHAEQRAFDGSRFDALRSESLTASRLEVRNIPVDGLVETLEVERFDVYDSGAEVRVQTRNGERVEAMPDLKFFRGRIAGRNDSLVFLSVGREITGLVASEGKRFLLKSSRNEKGEYFTLTPARELPNPEPYSCGVDFSPLPLRRPQALRGHSTFTPNAAVQQPERWTARLAIETDNELRAKFATRTDMLTYIANLVGAASVIYQADVRTTLAIGTVFDYEGIDDPWSATTADAALLEVADYWATTASRQQASVPRSSMVFLSGKDGFTSKAWTGTLGSDDFLCNDPVSCGEYLNHYVGAYAACLGLTGSVNTSDKSSASFWDVFTFAHELGHSFAADHTHCTASSGYGRTFVDYCENAEASRGCHAGQESVPAERGTLMSYCHLLSGGYDNVRLTFGASGEASYVMPLPMLSHINSVAPGGNAGAMTTVETVCGGTGGYTASYSNGGPGVTYLWSITNGSFTSSNIGNNVTFTAAPQGQVSLQVTVTNSRGTSTHATATIDNRSSSLTPSSVTVPSTGATSLRVSVSYQGCTSCSWTAVSNSSFIKIDSGYASYGCGSFFYSVPENKGLARSGTISVAGHLFVVTQEGAKGTPLPDHDLNGDAKADLFWRNGTTGDNEVWFMDGTTRSSRSLLPNAPANLTVVGIADFDGDGDSDMLFRNKSTGTNAMWLMNGATVQQGAYLPTVGPSVPAAMQVVGVGDLNDDAHADIVWRNNTTGENAVWLMQGTTVLAGAYLPPIPAPMDIVAVDDFNGDGKADIVFRSPDGTNAMWLMNGTTISYGAYLPSVTNGMQLAGSGDLDGDGNADLIWRDQTSGNNAVWHMNGATISLGATLSSVSSSTYLVAVGDFNDDDKEDLLWRNPSTGGNAVWLMNGASIGASAYLPTSATSLSVVAPK